MRTAAPEGGGRPGRGWPSRAALRRLTREQRRRPPGREQHTEPILGDRPRHRSRARICRQTRICRRTTRRVQGERPGQPRGRGSRGPETNAAQWGEWFSL